MISCTKSGSNVKVGVSQEATDIYQVENNGYQQKENFIKQNIQANNEEIPQKIFGYWSKIPNMRARANTHFFY